MGMGHTFSVDWWSLGVIAYELMEGATPFVDKQNSENLISNIKEGKISEFGQEMSLDAKDFIKKCL